MTGQAAIGTAVGVLAGIGGVATLRFAWRRRRTVALAAAGWILLAAGSLGWAQVGAADEAVALMLLVPSLVGMAVVALSAQVRPRRGSRQVKALDDLPDRSAEAAWHGLLRTLCGGPLAGAAALLVSAAWALKGPGSSADRAGLALLLAPMLWGAGLVWATTDARLARIGLVLAGLAIMGGAAGFL